MTLARCQGAGTLGVVSPRELSATSSHTMVIRDKVHLSLQRPSRTEKPQQPSPLLSPQRPVMPGDAPRLWRKSCNKSLKSEPGLYFNPCFKNCVAPRRGCGSIQGRVPEGPLAWTAFGFTSQMPEAAGTGTSVDRVEGAPWFRADG